MDQTRAGHFSVVPSPEDRVVISLNGETLQGHRLPATSSKQEDQHQQIVEPQRKENAGFAIRKVGYSESSN